jgi:hypothetical protein
MTRPAITAESTRAAAGALLEAGVIRWYHHKHSEDGIVELSITFDAVHITCDFEGKPSKVLDELHQLLREYRAIALSGNLKEPEL